MTACPNAAKNLRYRSKSPVKIKATTIGLVYSYATWAASLSSWRATKILSDYNMIMSDGMKNTTKTSLPLFKCCPQSTRSFAPKA